MSTSRRSNPRRINAVRRGMRPCPDGRMGAVTQHGPADGHRVSRHSPLLPSPGLSATDTGSALAVVLTGVALLFLTAGCPSVGGGSRSSFECRSSCCLCNGYGFEAWRSGCVAGWNKLSDIGGVRVSSLRRWRSMCPGSLSFVDTRTAPCPEYVRLSSGCRAESSHSDRRISAARLRAARRAGRNAPTRAMARPVNPKG